MSKTTHSISAVARPAVVERVAWQAEIDALRVREKAHTHEGDAIAAARRRLPMVEVDGDATLFGPGRPGCPAGRLRGPAAADRLLPHVVSRQARGRAVRRLHPLQLPHARVLVPALAGCHLRDVLSGPLRGERPLSRLPGLGDAVVLGRRRGRVVAGRPHLQPLLPDLLPASGRAGLRDLLDERPRGRGDGAGLRSLLDRTVFGRQEAWEESPAGWPQPWVRGTNPYRTDESGTPTGAGRPIAQWPRLAAGRSDDLGNRQGPNHDPNQGHRKDDT